MAKQSRAKRTRRILPAALGGLLAVAAIVFLLVGCGGDKSPAPDPVDLGLTLNEHSVALEKDETFRLRLIRTSDGEPADDVDVEWTSDTESIATVNGEGLVTGVSGGETLVKANFEIDDAKYSFSCVVTVKSPEITLSNYKVRYFTQNRDRIGYTSTEEVYEREPGSEVSLSQVDARRRLPGNYVLNTEKSVLSATVKKQPGTTVLDIYYDVAEITYYVDSYYESLTALGTYGDRVTEAYKAYAFSEVHAAPNAKEGFVLNEKAPGSVLSNGSVTAGAHLIAYYDRARSNVTVTYASGKPSRTFSHVYGTTVDSSYFENDVAPLRVLWSVGGKNVADPRDAVQYSSGSVTVAGSLDGAYVTYDNSLGALVNKTTGINQDAYAMMEKSGSKLYLKTTVTTTGCQDPNFGIILKGNGQLRMIHCSGSGLIVLRDLKWASGMNDGANMGLFTGVTDAGVGGTGSQSGNVGYVWAQNDNGNYSKHKFSGVQNMLRGEMTGGSHVLEFLVIDGWLYMRVDGEIAVSMKLAQLDTSWTDGTVYEIGLSTWYGKIIGDPLKWSNTSLATDDAVEAEYGASREAKAAVEAATSKNSFFGWDGFTGSYVPASRGADAYLSGKPGMNVGVTAHLRWMDIDNSIGAYGVTVDYGDQSYQFVAQFDHVYRMQRQHTWTVNGAGPTTLPAAAISDMIGGNLYNKEGTNEYRGKDLWGGDFSAYVKDGWFYVYFGGHQIFAEELADLFNGYNGGDVTVGLYAWDPNGGAAYFSDISFGTADAVRAISKDPEPVQWGFNFNTAAVDSNESAPNAATVDYGKGVIRQNGKSNFTVYLGGKTSTAWQLDATVTVKHSEGMNPFGVVLKAAKDGGDGYTRFRFDGNGVFINYKHPDVNGGWDGNFAGTLGAEGGHNTYGGTSDNNGKNLFWNEVTTFAAANATRTTVKIRALVYKDHLYMWTNTVVDPDGLHLVFAADLTQLHFGQFKAGSSYKFGINVWDCAGGELEFSDLRILDGERVTSQEDFLTVGGRKYTADAAAAAIEANIKHWKVDNTMRLEGALAENITVMRPENDSTAVLAERDDAAYSPDVYTKWTVKELREVFKQGNTSFGISVQSEDGTGRLVLLDLYGFRPGIYKGIDTGWGGGVYIDGGTCSDLPMFGKHGVVSQDRFRNLGDVANDYGWDVKAIKEGNVIHRFLGKGASETSTLEWIIVDGVLELRIDGNLAIHLPLEDLCAAWNANTNYRIGVFQWNTNQNNMNGGQDGPEVYPGVYHLSDIVYETGDAAEEHADKSGLVADAEASHMVYDYFGGTYIPTLASTNHSGINYLLGKGVAGRQSVAFTVTPPAGSASMNGLAVKAGDHMLYVLANAAGEVKLFTEANATDNNWTGGTAATLSEGASVWVNGKSVITATVDGNTLYISFNGKEALSVPLDGDWLHYGSGEIKLGAASYIPKDGAARFGEFSYKAGDDVPAVTADKYEAAPVNTKFMKMRAKSKFAYETGVLVLPLGGSVEFTESAKTWMFSGTMLRSVKKNDRAKAPAFSIEIYDSAFPEEYKVRYDLVCGGVKIYTGGDKLSEASCAYSSEAGFRNAADSTGATPPANIPEERKYHFRTDATDFMTYGHADEPASREELGFKIVIYEDVLYIWYDTAENPGQYQLNMRFPLTEAKFGGVTSGSEYSIVINTPGDEETELSQIVVNDFEVQIDSQVTGDKDFIKTVDGRSHTVADAAKQIARNIVRFSEDYRPTHMRLSGALAEGMEEYRVEANRAQSGTTNTNWFMLPKSAASKDIYLSSHITHTPYVPGATYVVPDMFGVVIKGPDGQVRQVLVNGSGLALLNNSWLANKEGDNTIVHAQIPIVPDGGNYNYYGSVNNFGDYLRQFGDNTTPVSKLVKFDGANTAKIPDFKVDFEAAITGNVLYIRVDGFTLARLPLEQLCTGWTDGSVYTMGFDVWDSCDAHGYRWNSVEALTGEEAAVKFHAGSAIEGGESGGMVFDPLTGGYYGSQGAATNNIITHILGKAGGAKQALSFKLHLDLENSGSLNGFALKSGGKTAYVLFSKDGKVHILSEEQAKDENYSAAGKDGSLDALATDNTVTGVVDGGKLYVTVNGRKFAVELSKVISEYSDGADLRLGVATYAPGKGAATFGEIKFTSGDAEDFSVAGEGYSELKDASAPAEGNIFRRILSSFLNFFAALVNIRK